MRPFVGPVKGSVGRAIVVSNKSQDASAQLLHGEATEPGKQATHEDREPDLNLVEPRTVSGSVNETNAMARVGEKGSACAQAGEMAAFAFDAQFLLDVTLRSDQAHQHFGLMSVELIGDKDPGCLGVSLNGLSNVSGKVGFGARRSNAGSHDLSGGHVQVSNQTQGAMPLVFKFLSLDVTGLHGQRGVETFQGLDAGHLIGARHMGARRGEHWGGLIHLTHRADLLS
jgi:hypothetical protein